MLVDDQLLTREDDHWVVSSDLSDLPVPSSIQALLAARVEGLPADQWAIVTAASVEGTVFHRGAVSDLTPDSFEPTLELNLMDLVRRDVIRPDFADFPGDEAYRFRHALIRDAAYRSLSKGTSADLHERFAGWLERAAGERLREFEEIVGYHLEQAFRCRAAIGSIDTHAATLATRSAQRLESAGRRALARSDLPAAIGLLERAADLLALDAPRRAALLPELGAALIEAGLGAMQSPSLRRRDSSPLRPRTIAPIRMRWSSSSSCSSCASTKEQPRRERAWSTPSIPVFETYRDEHGLCRARKLEALTALEHGARRGGSRGLGQGGRACSPRGRRRRAKRDSFLGRVVDVLRADAGARRGPPLRGDSRRGGRQPRLRGLGAAVPRRAARDGGPLRARPDAPRRGKRDLRGAGADPVLLSLGSRWDRRAPGRRSRRRRKAPSRRIPCARENGRQGIPPDHGCVSGRGALRAGARRGRRTPHGDQRAARRQGGPPHAGRLAKSPGEGHGHGRVASTRPKTSRRRL